MSLIDEFLLLLSPLAQLKNGGWKELLAQLGWAPDDIPGLPTDALEEKFAACQDAAVQFLASLGDDSTTPWTALPAAADVFAAINGLKDATGAPGVPAELAALNEDVAAYLVDTYGDGAHPVPYGAMRLLGLAQRGEDLTPAAPIVDPQSGATLRSAYARPRVSFEVLGDVIRDPRQAVKTLFGTDAAMTTQAGADALADVVMPKVAYLLRALGSDAIYVADVRPVDPSLPADQAELFRHVLLVDAAADTDDGELELSVGFVLLGRDQPQPGLLVVPSGLVDIDWATRSWMFSAAVGGVGEALILGPGGVQLDNGSAPELDCQVAGAWAAPAGGPLVIGDRAGVRVELGSIAVDAGVTLASGKAMFAASVVVSNGGLVVSGASGDGFLSSILPAQPVRVPFAGGLEWSSDQGLRIKGAMPADATLRLSVPTGLALGPVALPQVTVILGAGDSGPFAAATAEITAQLGPIAAAVDGFGLEVRAAAPGSGGNIGPLDLALALRPPTSIALQVTSDVVTGGGFLSVDPDKGQYAGGVQLKFQSLSLAAVGLLATKLPNGVHGYSLVVLVSVRFPPVELGFGISLTGVGGLVAVNRTVALDALRGGLQTGALDSVLFPAGIDKDPIKVVGDLDRYFPPAGNQYVVGPAAELQWGDGGLVTARIGLLIEFPSPTRIVLLGQLRLGLPTPATPIVDIQLDLLGSLDLTAKQLALDAVLRNSRVASFALTGQAALRAGWGTDPIFLLAVGGFSPAFQPPASFPVLERVALSLSQSANPRLRLQAYFALTSNTVQVGARLDLYASVDLSVLGTFAMSAMISFDALFQFKPFAFEIDIAVSVALLWNNSPFLAISLEVKLTGPQPWHAIGQATFTCFGRHTIPFELRIGDDQPPQWDPFVSLVPLITADLAKPENQAVEPPSGQPLVTLGGAAAAAQGRLLHPLGSLTVRERIAPLGLTLAKLGTSRLNDGPRYDITASSLGTLAGATSVIDAFAPAQYLDLSDDQKLAAPSFQTFEAGVRFGGGALDAPADLATTSDVTVETHIIGTEAAAVAPAAAPPITTLPTDVVLRQLAGAAAAVNGAANQGARAYAAPALGVAVPGPSYAVADTRTLAPVKDASTGDPLSFLGSYAVADEARRSVAGTTAGGVQVVDTTECLAPLLPPAVSGIDSSAYYTLTAVHSGCRLAVEAASPDPGARVLQQSVDAVGWQFWRLLATGDGSYVIVAEHSGLLIAPDAGVANGTPVMQAWRAGSGDQLWRLVPVAPDQYRIESVAAGRCLDVVGGPSAKLPGTPVQLWDWWGGTNQIWQLASVPAGALLRQRIRERAYALWVARGRPMWQPDVDWRAAEAQVVHAATALEAWWTYVRRGGGWGHALDDWLAAEREIRAELAST